jgi:hypothetical protein
MLERGGHWQDRERDLGMLVGSQPAAGLAHHLQEAERSPVGAVSQDPDVPHPASLAHVGLLRDHLVGAQLRSG